MRCYSGCNSTVVVVSSLGAKLLGNLVSLCLSVGLLAGIHQSSDLGSSEQAWSLLMITVSCALSQQTWSFISQSSLHLTIAQGAKDSKMTLSSHFKFMPHLQCQVHNNSTTTMKVMCSKINGSSKTKTILPFEGHPKGQTKTDSVSFQIRVDNADAKKVLFLGSSPTRWWQKCRHNSSVSLDQCC